jgi:hypothetical protein
VFNAVSLTRSAVVKSVWGSFFYLMELFLSFCAHLGLRAEVSCGRGDVSSLNRVHPTRAQTASLHRFGAAHQPSLRSQRTMMTYANSPSREREAGSLINRTVTLRTKPRFRHPRTGGTAVLLSTTTELLVIDMVA